MYFQIFHRSSHRSSRVTPWLMMTTTIARTVMPANTPVVSNVPSACEITYPRPRVAPRYSPTTAPTIANPRLVCRLAKNPGQRAGHEHVAHQLAFGGAEHADVRDQHPIGVAHALVGAEEHHEEHQRD